jgi:hypothetical protein
MKNRTTIDIHQFKLRYMIRISIQRVEYIQHVYMIEQYHLFILEVKIVSLLVNKTVGDHLHPVPTADAKHTCTCELVEI